MALNTDSSFPPGGNPPYRIDRDWCMGDSLPYMNQNFANFDNRLIELSTFFIAISSFSTNLSAKDSSTIDLNFNSITNTISAFIVDGSIDASKLGGTLLGNIITRSGRASLTASNLSGSLIAYPDVQISNLVNNQALVWNASNNRWENVVVATQGASVTLGLKNDIKVEDTANSWILSQEPGAEAVRDINIRTGGISPVKLSTGAPSWTSQFLLGVGSGITPTVRIDAQTSTDDIEAIRIHNPNTGASARSAFYLGNNTSNIGGSLFLNSSNVPASGNNLNLFNNIAAGSLALGTNGLERLRINSSGNVGINTLTPNERLTVIGNISATGNVTVTGNISAISTIDTSVAFRSRATDTASTPSFTWALDTNTGFYRPAEDTLGFVGGGTETVRINSSGNVGVGTISPNQRLTVFGNISATGNIIGPTTPILQQVTTETIILSSMNTSVVLGSASLSAAGLMTANDRILFNRLTEAILLSGQFIVDYLIVAGGGGGAVGTASSGGPGGGGGAGGYIAASVALNPNTNYSVIVGAGGAGDSSSATTNWSNGSNSSFNGLLAIGGGRGGRRNNSDGSSGGSGGGGSGVASASEAGEVPGTSTLGQGFSGGSGIVGGTDSNQGSGGGGGATRPGLSGTAVAPGPGGAGALWLDGQFYAGGGAGARYNGPSTALGGIGGGGNTGANGVVNTGGGGGGSTHNSLGSGAGGSGVVVIRYPGNARAVGGAYSYDAINNYSYHRFTQSDDFYTQFNPEVSKLSINYLVVGGGGGSGCGFANKRTSAYPSSTYSYLGGGGGAGGALSGTLVLPFGNTYTVRIGNGGAGGLASLSATGTNGQNTTLSGNSVNVTALGGGGGGAGVDLVINASGVAGGSGGGGAGTPNSITGGGGAAGTPGQGNAGSAGPNTGRSGAGGGARTSASTDSGGSGITWLNGVTYGAGGRGYSISTSTAGGPGTGNGADTNESIGDAGANGLAGGSGTIVISYPGSTYRITGGNQSQSGGFCHHVFVTDGTFTVTG